MSSFSPTIQQLFRDYALGHQDLRNRWTHYVGVPAIVLGIFGLLSRVTFGGGLDLGLLLWVLSSIFYIWHARWMAIPFTMLSFLICAASRFLDVSVLGVLFAGGWAIQLIGHHFFERRAPSFLENFQHLLVSPFWIYLYALRHVPGFGSYVTSELEDGNHQGLV
jgi:uncharacterized membrane protein YGL010W